MPCLVRTPFAPLITPEKLELAAVPKERVLSPKSTLPDPLKAPIIVDVVIPEISKVPFATTAPVPASAPVPVNAISPAVIVVPPV